MKPQIVGVIFSRADLHRALRMRRPPELFELRLDRLFNAIEDASAALEQLPAPFIITARHPREGGANHLSSAQRRAVLIQFMPHATYLDVELRSADALQRVLQSAAANHIRKIVSFHDFAKTPPASRLDRIASQARSLGAHIIKVATRTDTRPELDRLLAFYERQHGSTPIVAMGIGKLGRASRLELARRGCLFNYAHLGSPAAPGQLSVPELRRALS